MSERTHDRLLATRDVALAAAAAGTVSGLPSTVWAVATRRGALEAARAAATLIPGRRDRPGLIAGGVVHAVLSLFWTGLVATAMRRRRLRLVEGAAAGLAIAALDLAVVGRRYPAIRALPAIPQWCDHALFGAAAAAVLARRSATSVSQRTRR